MDLISTPKNKMAEMAGKWQTSSYLVIVHVVGCSQLEASEAAHR